MGAAKKTRKAKRSWTARELEPYMLAEAVRRHYVSLEGSGRFDEALFFLQWHNDNCDGLTDFETWREAGRIIDEEESRGT